MTTDNEEWRPVVGYEGLYEVSNLGRVRSVTRTFWQRSRHGTLFERTVRGKVLSPGRMPGGHLSVAVGKGNSRCVHDLVLSAFVGPRPPGYEGRHHDGDPSNNRLENLSWSTRGDNTRDKKWHRLPTTYKLRPPDVIEIRRALGRGEPQASIARRFDVSRSTISLIDKGKTHVDVPGVL